MFHPIKKEFPSIIYHIMSIQALFALVFSFLIPDHLQLCQLCSRRSLSAQGIMQEHTYYSIFER